MPRRIIIPLFLLAFVASLAACSSTWHGLKEDTSRNFHKIGNAVE